MSGGVGGGQPGSPAAPYPDWVWKLWMTRARKLLLQCWLGVPQVKPDRPRYSFAGACTGLAILNQRHILVQFVA